MHIESINSSIFCAKNTYLYQAQKATNKNDKTRFLSRHYEAKSRCHHLNFLKAFEQLGEIPDSASFSHKDILKMTKLYFKITYEELASINSAAQSYRLNPKR